MEEQYYNPQAQFPMSTTTTTDVHPSAVANATPTLFHLTSNHPSYAEMITAAILWDSSQGKAGGSSKRAIAKYIDRVYTDLPPTHSSLLTHHLKRLKNSGQLVMIKNSYQLPLLAASTTVNTTAPGPDTSAVPLGSANPTIKKRPGRPPKRATTTAIETETLSPFVGVGNGSSSTGKKPRGRPPRNLNINLNQTQQQHQVVAEVPFVQVQAQPNYAPYLGSNNGESQPVKRRAGRPPRKQQQEVVQPISQPQVQGGGVVVAGNGNLQKRRPGRPSKAGNVIGGPKAKPKPKAKGRGRPKRNALGPVVRSIGKKPRGRPPRQLGVAPVVAMKRRGRPPKAGVIVGSVVKPVRKYIGKTRGRPKKSASTLAKQQQMADEELIKKAENMQAKIRDAVSVLKPYFTNSNATDALTALQELEDLSTMDITAAPPLNPFVEPPGTAMLLDNATIQPYNNVPLQETIDAPVEPVSTIPAPQVAPLPPVLPFSISAPTMTDTTPFYMPPNVETQQPTSWTPSGGAQL